MHRQFIGGILHFVQNDIKKCVIARERSDCGNPPNQVRHIERSEISHDFSEKYMHRQSIGGILHLVQNDIKKCVIARE